MSDPIRIRDIPHGIVYRHEGSGDTDLSEVPTDVLRACMFRSKNAAYRARTSQIRAPAGLYEDVYGRCGDELNKRDDGE